MGSRQSAVSACILGVVIGCFGAGACGGTGPGGLFGPGSGAAPGTSADDAGSSSDASGSTYADAGASNGSSSGGSSSGGSGSSGGVPSGAPDTGAPIAIDAGSPCYSEPYDPGASLADLTMTYSSGEWLSAALTTMQRRYPTGYFVLDAGQNDPQLPQFVDSSSWGALMSSLMTMLDVETGQWDFDSASATVHPFVITDTLQISVTELTSWEQGEILQYVTGASTQEYDQTELQGQEGTYDGIFLLDDMDSACNGLAAATAVGDQLTYALPARDGVAAHLYYLELFLRAGRTNHASAYALLQADPTWQQIVRYEWARGFFWDQQAQSNPNLQTAVAPIWANIDQAANLAEIQLFTGDSPAAVACHP
jgi:hypothetical protein